ncbi:unnamed protein product [Cyclocybe aegerita]|uniref:BTB domain-containing protein n=1 Tax=Cyclocybe aegerita TaxID=1973307 RepID=A0A8S0WNW1_CYCAE|nr:unnamed protein product [Cyclocybe aegerita]
MSEPAAKRPKLASGDEDATMSDQPGGITRSEDFWLDDGNIILQAEGTQFRVHKSMLARHSTIFKDMFSFPQPAEPLDPDVEVILSIFYDNIKCSVIDLEKALSIDQIKSILSMAKKYDITYLRDRALERLRRCFPTTVKGWDASFGDANGPTIHFKPPLDTVEAVIALALEHGIPSILPSAYLYLAALVPPEKIVGGDKSILSLEARLQCILGRDNLIREIHSSVQLWWYDREFMPPERCTMDQLHPSRAEVLDAFVTALWLTDEKTVWDFNAKIPTPAGEKVAHLCPSCADTVKLFYRRVRREIWRRLPELFDLPPWRELKDFDVWPLTPARISRHVPKTPFVLELELTHSSYTMSEPPAKRPRLASDDGDVTVSSTESASGITRSTNFWLDDGNIILQAENTQFRVHKSMLARQSSIFKDMFSIPQPSEPLDPVVEGCPVVTLSDKASDVDCILSIFYDNVNVVDLGEALSIDQLAVILCMGKKYDITYLRDRALKKLRRCFPTTINGWDASLRDGKDSTLNFDPLVYTIESVISLAHTHGIPSILPSAFLFYASQVPPDRILRGDYDVLSHEARIQCILGRDDLAHRIYTIVQGWTADTRKFMSDLKCEPDDCAGLSRMEVLEDLGDVLWLADEKTVWGLNADIPKRASDTLRYICEPCATSVKKCYDDARQEIWKELPEIFALPEWEQLKDFDT